MTFDTFTSFFGDNVRTKARFPLYRGEFNDIQSAKSSGAPEYTIGVNYPDFSVGTAVEDFADDVTFVEGLETPHFVGGGGSVSTARIYGFAEHHATAKVDGCTYKLERQAEMMGWKFGDVHGVQYKWHVRSLGSKWELRDGRGTAIMVLHSKKLWVPGPKLVELKSEMSKALCHLALLSLGLTLSTFARSKQRSIRLFGPVSSNS